MSYVTHLIASKILFIAEEETKNKQENTLLILWLSF